mmetsp:Transcript_91667/g.238927  ORF Transcript_91667/g.238927 Transcript_91667/m.238927 type:complete len:244 (+) Transcript_91667:839-1570(+)
MHAQAGQEGRLQADRRAGRRCWFHHRVRAHAGRGGRARRVPGRSAAACRADGRQLPCREGPRGAREGAPGLPERAHRCARGHNCVRHGHRQARHQADSALRSSEDGRGVPAAGRPRGARWPEGKLRARLQRPGLQQLQLRLLRGRPPPRSAGAPAEVHGRPERVRLRLPLPPGMAAQVLRGGALLRAAVWHLRHLRPGRGPRGRPAERLPGAGEADLRGGCRGRELPAVDDHAPRHHSRFLEA